MALDNSETHMAKSLARLHIRQGMLLLKQMEDFPTIQRAIRVFDWVLSQKDSLSFIETSEVSLGASNLGLGGTQRCPGVSQSVVEDPTLLTTSAPEVPIESCQWWDDFLRFDFLNNLELPEGN